MPRLGDGWLASGYNATPERLSNRLELLDSELRDVGRDPNQFHNAIATMFSHVTDNEADASRIIGDKLAPTLNRPPSELADRPPIGSADSCADKLAAYRDAGVERVYLWPIDNELEHLRIFQNQVVPAAGDSSR